MMTRAEYIESLRRLNLKVYFMGELIENPVDHPMIRPSMNSVACAISAASIILSSDIFSSEYFILDSIVPENNTPF